MLLNNLVESKPFPYWIEHFVFAILKLLIMYSFIFVHIINNILYFLIIVFVYI